MEYVPMKIHGTIMWLVCLGFAAVPAAASEPGRVQSGIGLVNWAEPLDYDEFTKEDFGDKSSCGDYCSACPCAYGYVEFLFLERVNCGGGQPLIIRGENDFPNLPIETVALNSSDLNFHYDPAMRVVLGHRLHNGWAIEGGYFGFCDSDASAYLSTSSEDEYLRVPDGEFLNVFGDGDRFWVDYSSQLHSGELNLVCCNGCCSSYGGKGKGDGKGGSCGYCCRTFEWFVGFRYLNLSERFRIRGERDLDQTGGDTGTETGYYDVRTRNNLYGPQIGARVRRWNQRWGWETTGKVGIFGNDARQRQEMYDFPDFPAVENSASGGQVAFLGELNFTGIYRLNEVWNLRAGYNLIWIGGVALAPDQLDFAWEIPAGDRLDRTGGLFLHGVSCGIEARW
jgi:hypothetical protein